MMKTKNPHSQFQFSKWIHSRFATDNPKGFILTIGIILSFICLGIFIEIAKAVILKNSLISFDLEIFKWIPTIRTNQLTSFFTFITFLANWQSVVLACFVSFILLFRKKQIFTIFIFALSLIAAEGTGFILKYIVARTRPEETLRLIFEENFSFPSGHTIAATIVFGFLGYLLLKSYKNVLGQIFIFVGTLSFIFLVAFSRVYLGVHFPTDVFGSLSLGCLILTIFITIFKIHQSFTVFQREKFIPMKELMIVPVILLIFSCFFHSYFIPVQELKTPELTSIHVQSK